jgi:putative FmdB family regulatory protein
VPTYDWTCEKCDKGFETIESIKEYSGKAECPTCGNPTTERNYSRCLFYNVGASVENAEYNPAFGQIVKNSKHRKELAKAHGLVEIGNEPTEKIHKKFESDRSEKRKKAWDDV